MMVKISGTLPRNQQAGLCLASLPLFKNLCDMPSVQDVCNFFNIPKSTAYQEKRRVEELALFEKVDTNDNAELAKMKFKVDVLQYELDHPECRLKTELNRFTPEYKDFVLTKKEEYKLNWNQVEELLNIPINTLKKFSRFQDYKIDSPIELPPEVIYIINEYLRSGAKKKSTKGFYYNNSKIFEEINMSYRNFNKILLNLGLTSPTGIFKTKTILDKLMRFKPNMVWGTDGKTIVIKINGKFYKLVWQCLIDYKTTVIVGGLIDETENTRNLFLSLENAFKKWQSPLAIVLDNRLSENLPVISEYLEKHGIEIIKTFPGNPKSNGITEGNFSIFEHYMGGMVEINGKNDKELSESIGEMLVEVFTQLRNNKPRNGQKKTPLDAIQTPSDITDEEITSIRTKLKAIAERFKKENEKPVVSEQKDLAIKQALNEINPPAPDAFIKGLSAGRNSADLVLQALSIFKTIKETHPENDYNHHYFGGILNNLINSKHLELLHSNLSDLYYDNWESLKLIDINETKKNLIRDPVKELISLLKSFMTMPIPAYKTHLLALIKECFLIASKSTSELALVLRDEVAKITIKLSKYSKQRREEVLLKIHEWTNQIKLYEEYADNINRIEG